MEYRKKYAIIVAGRSGLRFGSEIPKQFLPLKGLPVLMHTIKRFAGCDIILVLPISHYEYWQELCKKHGFDIPHRIVAGGGTRFDSVKNAITTIVHQKGDLIAVHDGVRPLVSEKTVTKCFEDAAKYGSAIPAISVTDSIRRIHADGKSESVPRSELRAVQTPQIFDAKLLIDAYNMPYSDKFTDDASVVESFGKDIHISEGESSNIKITHPQDLKIAELLLEK